MAKKISYEEKVAININPTIPDINKCNATDMNEIKDVVNSNADELETKVSIPVSATPPENPQDGDLWIDTSEEGLLAEVDQEVSDTSSNAVSNKAITNYVNGLNTYSPNETVVGIWENADGSKQPLYRKIIRGTSPSTIGEWVDALEVGKGINIKHLFGMLSGTLVIPYYITSDYYIAVQYNNSNGYLQMNVRGYNNAAVEITLEYTKTTATTQSEEV